MTVYLIAVFLQRCCF